MEGEVTSDSDDDAAAMTSKPVAACKNQGRGVAKYNVSVCLNGNLGQNKSD